MKNFNLGSDADSSALPVFSLDTPLRRGSMFWFDKATQLVVRRGSPLGDGKVPVKTLID